MRVWGGVGAIGKRRASIARGEYGAARERDAGRAKGSESRGTRDGDRSAGGARDGTAVRAVAVEQDATTTTKNLTTGSAGLRLGGGEGLGGPRRLKRAW